jgi:itaconate CoA-transferase
MAITGTPEEPVKVGVSIVDFTAGIYAFSSIMTALYRRAETGEGATIRANLFDAILEWMNPAILQTELGAPPQRAGPRHAVIVPYGPYRVGGGDSVYLAVQNDRDWQRLCSDVLDRPDWATDPRFDTNEKRLSCRTELEPMVEEALASLTVTEAEARLEAAALPYSRLNGPGDLLGHPQVNARDRLIDVQLPGGSVRIPRSPFNLDGIDDESGRVPALGEHTDAVLREIGYSATEIKALRNAKAVDGAPISGK